MKLDEIIETLTMMRNVMSETLLEDLINAGSEDNPVTLSNYGEFIYEKTGEVVYGPRDIAEIEALTAALTLLERMNSNG